MQPFGSFDLQGLRLSFLSMKRGKATSGGWRQWLARKLGLAIAPLGQRGEAYAAKYLRRQGMKIVVRNRTHGKGEIDLIAIDGKALVFVEVRARASEDFGSPESSIRFEKRKTILKTARKLIQRHGRAGLTPRFDVIAIVWPNEAKVPTIVRHHRGALTIAEW
jgi:putative endonuclease